VHGFDHGPYGSPAYSFDRAAAAAQPVLQVPGRVAKESTGCAGREQEAWRVCCRRSRKQLGYSPTPVLLSPCSLKQQEQGPGTRSGVRERKRRAKRDYRRETDDWRGWTPLCCRLRAAACLLCRVVGFHVARLCWLFQTVIRLVLLRAKNGMERSG
jgi:hypothetical protein